MELLLSFFLLIISSVVGITIGLLLGMRSYLKLAIFVICIFIIVDLSYDYFNKDIKSRHSNVSNNSIQKPIPNSKPNIINTTTTNVNTNPETTTETTTENIKYASVDNTSIHSNDKPPFDNLEPSELLSRLNYIYYATANPLEPINYSTYKTHADNLIDNPDNSNNKLSTNDPKLLEYSRKYYPQLTDNQIDAKDCLNYGSSKGSCFQNPSLFFNVKNDFNILTKGVNESNSNLIVREDFSNPMIMNPNARYESPLFSNAPNLKLDKPLDQESNETINLDTTQSMCKNCKLAICDDDYCGPQNQLFM